MLITAQRAAFTAGLFIGCVVGIPSGAAIATAAADKPPACDQADVTTCYWDAEVDGGTVQLPGCAEEDGNVNGLPCLWRDPDTNAMFYVDSANYRVP